MSNEHGETWWKRNWHWLVPVLVLSAATTIVILVASLVWWVANGGDQRMYLDWDVISARTDTNAQIKATLGTPVQPDGLVSGQICTKPEHKRMNTKFRVVGPGGKGIFTAIGARTDGRWQWNTLQIVVDGSGQRIDLLGPGDIDPATGERWPAQPCWKIPPLPRD